MTSDVGFTQPVLFFLSGWLPSGIVLATVASGSRSRDVGHIHTSWNTRLCRGDYPELCCETIPLVLGQFVEEPKEPVTEDDCIRWGGQNQIELRLCSDSTGLRLPCFVTTSTPFSTIRRPVHIKLRSPHWAAFPDFLADNAFWVERYRKYVEAGDFWLKSRMEDYALQHKLAVKLPIAPGDLLAFDLPSESGLRAGCIVLSSIVDGGFAGTAYAPSGTLGSLKEFTRVVRWSDEGVEKQVSATFADVIEWGPEELWN